MTNCIINIIWHSNSSCDCLQRSAHLFVLIRALDAARQFKIAWNSNKINRCKNLTTEKLYFPNATSVQPSGTIKARVAEIGARFVTTRALF